MHVGATAGAVEGIAAELRALPPSPFHLALESYSQNDPGEVAEFITGFAQAARGNPVRAVYLEMNGFDINPDRWYCDIFGYTQSGAADDLTWLSSWDDHGPSELTLVGMEALQAVYASPVFDSGTYASAAGLASLLVVAKFQDAVRRALERVPVRPYTVLATAHEYDFIASFAGTVPTRS